MSKLTPAELERAFLDRFARHPDAWALLSTPLVLLGSTADVLGRETVVLGAKGLANGAAYRKRLDREFQIACHGRPSYHFVFVDLEGAFKREKDPERKAVYALLAAFARHDILFNGVDLYVTSEIDPHSRTYRLLLLVSLALAIDDLYNRSHSDRELLAKLVFEALDAAEHDVYSLIEVLGLFFGSSIVDFAPGSDLLTPVELKFPLNYYFVDVGDDELNGVLRARLVKEIRATRPFFGPVKVSDEEFFRAMARPAASYAGEVIKLRAQYCFDEAKLVTAIKTAIQTENAPQFLEILQESVTKAMALLGDDGKVNPAHSAQRVVTAFKGSGNDVVVVPLAHHGSRALIIARLDHAAYVKAVSQALGLTLWPLSFGETPITRDRYDHGERP